MIQSLITGLKEFLYPRACLGCKKRIKDLNVNILVCPSCWNSIKKNVPPFCHCCGRKLAKGAFSKNICLTCLRKKFHFDRAFSPCVYEGLIKELIHEFKYKGKDYLSLPLSKLMIDFIKEYNFPIYYMDFILPMPLSKARLREREFNQAQALSEQIGKHFNKGLLTDALIRHRHTKTQTDLEFNDRLLNVQGCFSLKSAEKVKGKNLLLIDDVLTTGATSSEAAKTLKESGANIVFVLTLAN